MFNLLSAIRPGSIIISLLLIYTVSFAQTKPEWEESKISGDPFAISYKEVFNNMHYNQRYRPQFHYTPITGQIADAVGLIWYKGTYHLFNMYDEWSRSRKDNKNWGHAISNDLVFWYQQPQILNTVLDNRPGSGGGIVDWNNTLKLESGTEKTLVVFYTDYERGICLAFSRDSGETWIRHEANPIIPMPEGRTRNLPRDPLVFWYPDDNSWKLVLYDEPGFKFYQSTDLLNWEYLSRIDGFYECPDFIQLPVEQDPNTKKWVIIDGDGTYRIGDFNGKEFISNMDNTKVDYSGELYATQSWKHSYEGDGPVVQIGMIRLNGKQAAKYDSTWTMQQSFPCELSLRNIGTNLKLCRTPIKAIKQLRHSPKVWDDISLDNSKEPLIINGEVLEVVATIDIGKAKGFKVDIRGEELVYSNGVLQLGDKYAKLSESDQIQLQILIDRGSIEVFANDGEISFTKLFFPNPDNLTVSLSTLDKELKVISLEAYQLNSIWIKREQELGYFRDKN